MRTRALVVGVVVAVAAVLPAGCADDSGSADGAPTDAPTAVPPTESVTEPPTVPTEPPTTEPPVEPPTTEPPDTDPSLGLGELIGVPEPGVEAGCWLVDGYLLLGGDESLLSSGQRLRITGHVERDVATTCQQGTPFRVDDAVPAE